MGTSLQDPARRRKEQPPRKWRGVFSRTFLRRTKELRMTKDPERSGDLEWDREEGFRETMLFHFRPKKAKALKRLARMLLDHALESYERRIPRKGSWTAGKLQAAAGDLRHLGHFLRSAGETAEQEAGLAPEAAARLAALARSSAEKVAQIVRKLEEALEEEGREGTLRS
jgi:hypothetical protein